MLYNTVDRLWTHVDTAKYKPMRGMMHFEFRTEVNSGECGVTGLGGSIYR